MLDISDFSQYRDGTDWTPALNRALETARKGIFFPAGTYHFYPEHLPQEYCFFSNNDEGLKAIVFNIRDREDFTITGNQAEFIFHGRVVPFRCRNTRKLTISGINIDFEHSFVVRALVKDVSPESMTLAFANEQFYRIIHRQICFTDDEYKFILSRIPYMAYDPERREPLADGVTGSCSLDAVEIQKGLVKFSDFSNSPNPGDTLIMKPEPRLCPGIVLDDCRDVKLEELQIYHCGGMAVLAQNCHNLYLKKVNVMLREGSSRLVSATDDAAHFVQCSGYIKLFDCRFENQKDDAVNIHGIYQTYLNRLGKMLCTGHYQQLGIATVRPGEKLQFGDFTVKIKEVIMANKQYSFIIPELPIPDTILSGTSVMNIDRQPNVHICGCTFRNNSPRGVLVSSGGKVLIEKNYFHTPGSAIFIAGDDIFWYESGPVQSVNIRENHFDNCLYHHSCRKKAVIDIHPEICTGQEIYHRNIHIDNNSFTDSHRRLLYAENTDNIAFINNNWKLSDRYQDKIFSCPVHFSNCGRTVVKNNSYEPLTPTFEQQDK
jgi:hypothetical protein